jgi:hypothetical protein
MPGIGLEIDRPMQHAPQPLRQFMAVPRHTVAVEYSLKFP